MTIATPVFSTSPSRLTSANVPVSAPPAPAAANSQTNAPRGRCPRYCQIWIRLEMTFGATKTATANTLIGVATEAVAGGAGDVIGRVRLNGSF